MKRMHFSLFKLQDHDDLCLSFPSNMKHTRMGGNYRILDQVIFIFPKFLIPEMGEVLLVGIGSSVKACVCLSISFQYILITS